MSTTPELRPSRPARISLSHRAPFGALDREHAARRALNIVVAAVGLVMALPLMLLIAVLIKLTSRGPVLFTQRRVGLDRRSLSGAGGNTRSEEHTSELQSRLHLVCRLLLEKKKKLLIYAPDTQLQHCHLHS